MLGGMPVLSKRRSVASPRAVSSHEERVESVAELLQRLVIQIVGTGPLYRAAVGGPNRQRRASPGDVRVEDGLLALEPTLFCPPRTGHLQSYVTNHVRKDVELEPRILA